MYITLYSDLYIYELSSPLVMDLLPPLIAFKVFPFVVIRFPDVFFNVVVDPVVVLKLLAIGLNAPITSSASIALSADDRPSGAILESTCWPTAPRIPSKSSASTLFDLDSFWSTTFHSLSKTVGAKKTYMVDDKLVLQ
jgi:hypothetical protein